VEYSAKGISRKPLFISAWQEAADYAHWPGKPIVLLSEGDSLHRRQGLAEKSSE
jgi:hypothetical protein